MRKATHADSWYSGNKNKLDKELSEWLSSVDSTYHYKDVKAIIVPHAGYKYSGLTAAFGYRNIDPTQFNRIFILGPSHHKYMNQICGLTKCTTLATPFGNLNVDISVNQELLKDFPQDFIYLDLNEDEDEHSVEMHLPYIAKIFESVPNLKVVPIVVGSLNPSSEAKFGEMFQKYIADHQTFFVISSDFCHWGTRFRYTPYDANSGAIHQFIENLDKEGMNIIQKIQPEAFNSYIDQSKNTICGRHPIGVLINALNFLRMKNHSFNLKFIQYAQSEPCQTMRDSSVSYATAIVQQST